MPAKSRCQLTVRLYECDPLGHVNHAVYLTFIEQCRLMFWRKLTGAPKPATSVIVARVECDYRAPAYFGERLEVRLKVSRIGRSSFDLAYEIVNLASERRIAELDLLTLAAAFAGSVAVVALVAVAGRPRDAQRGRP